MAAWFSLSERQNSVEGHLQRYSNRIFSWIFALGGVGLFPFALGHWFKGSLLMAIPIALLVAVFLGFATWTFAGRRLDSGAVLVLTLFCNFVGLFALINVHALGFYWIYPLMLAVAFLVPWRWSAPINAANVIFTIAFAAGSAPEAHLYRLVITLFLTYVFTVLFSYNIERQQSALKNLAVHDSLTGIYNRRYFEQKQEEAYRHWKRTGRKSALVMIDIDHFKEINDCYGHIVGDRVLVALAEYISTQLRPLDLFFRLGGEEFALLLHETAADQAVLLSERLRRNFELGCLGGDLPAFTVSFGVADMPDHGSLSTWLEECDDALYSAKRTGRNRVVMAPPNEKQVETT